MASSRPRQRLSETVPQPRTLCLPRLSNGSEWLFHGKDEVSTGDLTQRRLTKQWSGWKPDTESQHSLGRERKGAVRSARLPSWPLEGCAPLDSLPCLRPQEEMLLWLQSMSTAINESQSIRVKAQSLPLPSLAGPDASLGKKEKRFSFFPKKK